jgi:hypothetical protein
MLSQYAVLLGLLVLAYNFITHPIDTLGSIFSFLKVAFEFLFGFLCDVFVFLLEVLLGLTVLAIVIWVACVVLAYLCDKIVDLLE